MESDSVIKTQFLGDLINVDVPVPPGFGMASSSFLASLETPTILANDHVSPALSSFFKTKTMSPTRGGEGSDCFVGHLGGRELMHMMELAKWDMKKETISRF